MQVIRSSIIIATLITNLLSQDFECKVDDRILYGIACIEKHKKRPVGYPYIISLNNEKDQKKAKTFVEIKDLFLDSRTLDCDNQERCVKVFNFLLSKGIKNLDNGGFQLNNLYWEVEQVADYFDPYKSYLKACEIVQGHNEKNWTWKNIAKYHSKTKKYNDPYKERLLSVIVKNYNQERAEHETK